MAEERKKGAAALYGKPPRIEDDKRDGDTPKGGGAPEKALDKAEETAGKPKSDSHVEGDMKSGTEAKGNVMAGTDGIETHHVHSGEREAMHGRHMVEHAHMHGRHEKEHTLRATGHHAEDHAAMTKRHHGERRELHSRHEREMKDMGARHAGAPDGGIDQKTVGESGTQPT